MQQQLTTQDTTDNQLIEFEPYTHNTTKIRVYRELELLNQGLSVSEIAEVLRGEGHNIDRFRVYRDLDRADFTQVVNVLVADIIRDLKDIDDVYKRNYLRAYLLGKIYSKKIVGELKTTTHTITEDRRTLRVALDHLDPDTVLKLNEALKKAEGIEVEYEIKGEKEP